LDVLHLWCESQFQFAKCGWNAIFKEPGEKKRLPKEAFEGLLTQASGIYMIDDQS